MAFTDGEVKLPLVGQTPKRKVFLAVGLAGAVVGLLWWRRRSSPATATLAEDPNVTDDLLGDDTLDGGFGGGGGAGVPAPSGGGSQAPVGASNSAWTAEVLEAYDGERGPMLAALGLYLTGKAVTHEQEILIDQAIALADYPPIHGGDGYPPAIRQQPQPGQAPRPTNPAPPSQPAPSDHPTLRIGSRGSAVSQAQSLLNRHGAHLAVDGKFGPLTMTAVMNFQRQQRIGVDGVIGPVTWSHLLT